MKITITKSPDYDLLDTFDPVELDNFYLDCSLTTDDEATAADVVKMIYKAMIIEGYSPTGIQQSLFDVAAFEAYESNKKLDLVDFSIDEIFNIKNE